MSHIHVRFMLCFTWSHHLSMWIVHTCSSLRIHEISSIVHRQVVKRWNHWDCIDSFLITLYLSEWMVVLGAIFSSVRGNSEAQDLSDTNTYVKTKFLLKKFKNGNSRQILKRGAVFHQRCHHCSNDGSCISSKYQGRVRHEVLLPAGVIDSKEEMGFMSDDDYL